MKKFLGFALLFTMALLVVGCTETTTGVDVLGGEYDTVTELASGFTSLENTNQNGAIDADGYYQVGDLKFKTVDTFKTIYQTEPTKALFNYLINSWTYNSEHYTNMVDGLVENDKYSNLVGAMALGYKVVENTDGTETWTFQLKENVPWVRNSDGTVYAEVTAYDFVAGVQYVLDPLNGSATATIITSVVKGAEEYFDALASTTTTDDLAFSTVGVKAISKYQVEYTLNRPTPYFLSSLTYSPYLPVCQAYLDEVGTDFGKTVNDILVNGAFRITEHNPYSLMEYTKNVSYYDAKHVYVNTILKRFVPGTATIDTTRLWFEAGYIDSFTVQADDTVGYANYVLGTDSTGTIANPANSLCNGVPQVGDATYVGYFNFVRTDYEYAVSGDSKTEAEKAATAKAVLNVNFRKGVLYGLKVMEALARYNPNQPSQWLMRGFTIRELSAWNGKDYADYVDAVYNLEQGTTGITLTGITQGSDPVWDAAKSATYFATAKTELKANAGLTDADFPIQIDVIGSMIVTRQPYELAMYGALELAGTGVIDICYNVPRSDDENTDWGSVIFNYDFSMWSGWGPDYADPQTFLHCFAIGGDMVENFGFDGTVATEALEASVLGGYDALYQLGAAITDVAQTDSRYQKFAEAEYALIYDYALIVPWQTRSGYSPVVSKTVPYQAGRASYGLTSDKLKNVIVTESAINKTQRAAVVAAYEAGK